MGKKLQRNCLRKTVMPGIGECKAYSLCYRLPAGILANNEESLDFYLCSCLWNKSFAMYVKKLNTTTSITKPLSFTGTSQQQTSVAQKGNWSHRNTERRLQGHPRSHQQNEEKNLPRFRHCPIHAQGLLGSLILADWDTAAHMMRPSGTLAGVRTHQPTVSL